MIVNWTASMTADLWSTATSVISDLSPLMIMILGIGIALIVFYAIISAIRGHN
jgi:hypothetical protein